MLPVLPANPRQSFGQKLNIGLGRGLESLSQMQQQNQQQQQMHQENIALKQMGIDLTGISDPKARQEFVAAALQGANQQQLEMLKQQGKQNQIKAKEDYLSKLFGGFGQDQNQSPEMLQGQTQQKQGGFDIKNISDEQIAKVAVIDPNLARVMQSQKDVALREEREEEKRQFELGKEERKREHEIAKVRRKEETEVSKPVLLELNQARKNIPVQEQSIEDIQNAVADISPLDYIADVTGFEPLRSASGAKLKTAIKDFFLSDLTRFGGRPNMFIEKQLAEALPKLGRSKEANLVVAAGMKFKVDLAKKRIEIIDRLAEEDKDKFGYVRGNIDSRASNEMKKYVVDRQKQLKDEMEAIKKAPPKGVSKMVRVRSPDGEIFEIERNDLNEAQEHGFQLTG